MRDKSFISPQENIREITFRVLILAIILTLILATANAYLALKLGILTSASIPAAIISMGILRFFKQATILENNAVQTAASAGEAVAGGIVYTIPALIIIGYWNEFDYWTNFLIAVTGGILGVLFSIPLRQILVHDPSLHFPEGRAIAEVLKTSAEQRGVKDIFLGGLFGALLQLFQSGFKIIATAWHYFFQAGHAVFGIAAGFSVTILGAGYLIGFAMALSILIGALLAWLIVMPITSLYYPELFDIQNLKAVSSALWDTKLTYLGIGSMLFAGIWTFIQMIRPLYKSIGNSLFNFFSKNKNKVAILRTEKDVPLAFIVIGIICMGILLFVFFQQLFPTTQIGLKHGNDTWLIIFAVIYVLFIGFLFSVITAYFSGMVGVSASPGSSVVIAGMLFAAWLLLIFVNRVLPLPFTPDQLIAMEAITIIIGSIVTGIAAIANDNTQDLKVGQLVGATPWKQQLMLLLGVIVASLIIPPVMEILFNVYGIAGVMPVEGMDKSTSLPAPTSAIMAAVTKAVFSQALPWEFMLIGAALMLAIIIVLKVFKVDKVIKISILGIAIGMYLPLATSMALFFGGLIAVLVEKLVKRRDLIEKSWNIKKQRGTLIACGLVAGAALMDVVLSIPFSLFHSPEALSLVGPGWKNWSVLAAIISTVGLAAWIVKRTSANPSRDC